MVDIEHLKEILSKRLTPARYKHSLGVCETASKLAKLYGVSLEKAEISGLLHDYAKDISKDEAKIYIKKYKITIDKVIAKQIDLAHGMIGAELVRHELGIEDPEVLNAIRYHTTGREEMSKLDKIIYLSDYIEPNRDFPGVEDMRKMALTNLNKATLLGLDNSIQYVLSKGNLLHINSILARNSLIEYMM
ncbi:MAG: hypothetical protein PWQ37_777 [Candidatus Petromonas sp.]|nr:hypothetical protein [Candidatus Petromonas sp.]